MESSVDIARRGPGFLSQEMEAAYQRYLDVFPCYWNPDRHVPVNRKSFLSFFETAKWFEETYERELQEGILSPVVYYAAINLGQFLGIPRTAKELQDAFKYGFAYRENGHR